MDRSTAGVGWVAVEGVLAPPDLWAWREWQAGGIAVARVDRSVGSRWGPSHDRNF